MSRTYYNRGSSGRSYSQLAFAKTKNGRLSCILIGPNGIASATVELDSDQIKDLIVQLESLKDSSCYIEGNL